MRLRALFGVGARAEVVRAFLADPSARLSAADIAADAGYTKRNIAEALEALRMAGLLEIHALRNQRLYGLLRRRVAHGPAGRPAELLSRVEQRLSHPGRSMAGLRGTETMPARARNVKASDVLRDLRSDFRLVGVRLSEAEQGPEAWTTLQRLAVDLSREWVSGSFASTG